MAVHRQGECWISRRYKRALTGTANGGRHKAMPCQAEEVLKAPVGQPAFQQLKGATALYCLPAPRLLCRRLAARYFGGPAPGMLPSPLIGELALRILARLSSDASLLRLQIRTDAPAHRRLWLPSGDRETVHHATCSLRLSRQRAPSVEWPDAAPTHPS